MAAVRNEILAGVYAVKVLGTPGTLIVHGTEAVAVMTDKRSDVLIAASQMGQGRVVVFSHDAYINLFLGPPSSNQKLVQNVKSWVTYRTGVEDDEIENADNYNEFDDIPPFCRILVWIGMREKSPAFYQKMRAWINNGGGFICGATGWGYKSLYPNKSLNDLPLTNIINFIGVRNTDLTMGGRGNLDVFDNMADNANVNDAIRVSMDNLGNLAKYGRNISGAITYCSDSELQRLLPSISRIVERHRGSVNCIPRKSAPVTTGGGKILAALINKILIRTGQFSGDKVAPGTDEFPGNFSSPPPLTSSYVSAESKGHPTKTFQTGYYLPAGQEITVVWGRIPSNNWSIVVGSHSDQLYNVNGPLRRWPQIQIIRRLEKSPLKFRSPFGGAIYLKSPPNTSESITVSLENVVATPTFSPGKGSDWRALQSLPGLWADISGKRMSITLPSSSIRTLSDPTNTMALWDRVVSAHLDLRGTDPYSGRGQWAVTDEQPSVGYMHSGYPVVTQMDVADPKKTGDDGFLLNGTLLRTRGMWGMFHEIGHNLQDPSWTFRGTTEVTCNIFTLHAMEVITGQKPWTVRWLRQQFGAMRTYLQNGADFNRWRAQPGVALAIYAQFGRDFGWGPYKAVFREYNNLSPREKPQNDDQKIDQWILRFSNTTRRNLLPMFEFWGFPIRDYVRENLRALSPYLHSDETTNTMAPGRAAAIRRRYGMGDEPDVELEESSGDQCLYDPTEDAEVEAEKAE